MFFLPCLFF